MDYRSFFADVTEWMTESNNQIQQHSIDSQAYWDWVVHSTGELCNKYHNHELVKKQMSMLIDWLDSVWKKSKGVD